MDSEKLYVKVHNIKDSNKLNYLGSYQFDLQRVYNSAKDHCLHNQWIGLFNYENEDLCGINGFLRLSISVLHESDAKVALIATEENKKKSSFILPPQLRQNMSFHQLAFYFYSATNIPDMDSGPSWLNTNDLSNLFSSVKSCQAYLKVEYGDLVYKTEKRHTDNGQVIWNQIIRIPIPEPRVSDKVFIRLYDADTTSQDDLIGTYELSLDDVIEPYKIKKDINKSQQFRNKYDKPRQIVFYGSDPLKSSQSALSQLMDENAEIGMMYKGTIIMKVLNEEGITKPIRGLGDFKPSLEEKFDQPKYTFNAVLRLYNFYSFNTDNPDGSICNIFFLAGSNICGDKTVNNKSHFKKFTITLKNK